MANKDDYLTEYRKFFEDFAETVNPHDQLPVKLACYKLVNVEVVGGIIDWTTQYLTQKQCPENLIAPLIKIVIDEIRKACKKHPVACGYNTSDEAYEPLKLMQCVMAKTNEVCLRYLDNSMLCSLPSPGPPYNVVSVSALKNLRRKMEDRHVVVHDLNTMFNVQKASPSSYYAIFDGHAGHDAAVYSSAHLHQFLAESKHFIHNPEQALIDAFCKTDALFIDKCKVEKLSSGTTAVCALLRPKEKTLYIAWVGDSQALLVNQGKVLQCVIPHKPSREDEKNRIENQGGMVIYWGTWRVNGQLAVSRAIGDAEYKPYVTATPDVQEVPLSGDEDFLILACDGLWDFLSEDEAAFAVYNMVCTNPDDTESISHHLAQLAKQKGSTDNISVIVVFLREPSKVAADAHWANRNRLTMEAGLDNANATNNLFTNSNGAEILQQKEGYLLNLTEGFKQNGAELSPADNYVFDRPTNGKRPAEEFDEDEDMGPETDVDAIDDLSSPTSEQQILDNKNLSAFDPFTTEIEEKASFEMDLNIQKQQSSEFDPPRSPREETPTPPANEVHDAGVEENVADSGEDSEDEWNYYKGDSGDSEKVSSSKADQEVAALTKTVEEEDEEAMSQLNPNAAEFVPIASPTRNVASPACRALLNDQVIAQSPRKATPTEIDINLPNPQDFENEVKSRPSDLFNNSQDSENNQKLSSQEVMENLLNGKNIDDIEFHPASTPVKISNPDEFHFGPNATPFSTPAKLMDQSEAALSTKAEFGDESTASYLEGKTLESENTNPFTSGEDVQEFHTQLNKPTDPMSMSFYQDENDSNPFDLNKVQMLPDDDEFADKPENDSFANETISDLPEHDPLEHNELVTDLDKPADTQSEDLFGFSKLPQTPEPILSVEQEIDKKEELICDLPIAKSPILIEASKAPLPITPEPNSEEQENIILIEEKISSPIPPKSPLPDLGDNFGVCDVKPSVESDLIVVSEQRITPTAFSPEPTELADVFSKSPLPIDDLQMPHEDVLSKSPLPDDNLSISDTKSPYVISPEPVISPEVTEDLLCQPKSPIPINVSKSPVPTSELVTEITEKPDEHTEEFFKLDMNTETSKTSDVLDNVNFQETDYFPICSKSPVSDVPPLIHDTKEEFQETEYFPICSKSPVSDVPPLELESKVEIQEQTILTELINVKEPSKSPIPLENEPDVLNIGPSKSPEPILTDLTSTIIDACESNLIADVPKDEIVDVKSPVPPPQETLSAVEVSDLLEKLSETENENKISQSFSPEPIESPKEELQNLQMSEQLLINEIQNILDASEPVVPTECEAKSPETIEESLDSEKRDLESPMEDITSSVKDDNSLSPEIIEEAKDFSTEKEIKRDDVPTSAPQLEISNQDYAQELCSAMQEHSETILEKEVVCQVSSTPNTTLSIDTESVNTADVNSFLNRSNVLDVTSPLSPNEQTEPLPTEDIVKTDLITPQYPEEAVITPSDEAKTETPIADNAQAPTALPEVVSEAEIKEKEEVADKTIIAPIIGAAAAVATAAAATTAIVKDKKSSSKSLTKAQPTAKKTTKPATTPTPKTTAKPTSGKSSTTSKSSVLSPTKSLPTATKTTKPPTTTKPPITSRTTFKPSPKPKTEVPVTKSIEKKTLTNGAVKALPKTSPAVRKVPATSTVSARTSLTSKLSPTKTDSKSSVAKTSTTTVTKSTKETVPKTTSSTLSAVSKPRPTSLTSKTSSTTKPTSSVSTTKTTVQSSKTSSTIASSPRTTTAKLKPPTSLTAKPPTTAPKPRLAPKTPTKGPDTEKQLKESVNKQLTATRTTTTTKTSGTFSTGRTTTTVKKTEMKSPSTRTSTTTKTTVMTIKPTTKKPAEITRINKKTAPTKTTIKSQENGLTNGVTTIVQETTTILSTEPQLIKDLSPVENKLIVDNSQLSETNVAD